MLIFRVVSFPKRISSEALACLGLIAECRSRSNNRSLSYVSLVLRATGEWEKSHKTPKSWIVFFSPFLPAFLFCRDAKNHFCLALVMLDQVKVFGNMESIAVGLNGFFLALPFAPLNLDGCHRIRFCTDFLPEKKRRKRKESNGLCLERNV